MNGWIILALVLLLCWNEAKIWLRMCSPKTARRRTTRGSEKITTNAPPPTVPPARLRIDARQLMKDWKAGKFTRKGYIPPWER